MKFRLPEDPWLRALIVGGGAASLVLIFSGWTRKRLPGQPILGGEQERVYVLGGTLYGPGSISYRITPTDVLWLKRMVAGEAGDSPSRQSVAALLWAMAQYHMLVIGPRGARPRFSSLTLLLRAYSQPLSASWGDPNSSKCRQHPDHCTARHIARRARIQRQTSFSQAIEGPVAEFLAGRLENPVRGMTDWRAGSWDGCRINVAGNCFGVSPARRLA